MVSYVEQGVSARRGARCFNEIEAAPPEIIARLQEQKLQTQLACLRQHHSSSDWGGPPFTGR